LQIYNGTTIFVLPYDKKGMFILQTNSVNLPFENKKISKNIHKLKL